MMACQPQPPSLFVVEENTRQQGPHDEQDGSRVSINVGGVMFETYVATLQNISETRLSWLTADDDPQQKCLFFDRHPGAFIYVLNFYRTGKLHAPLDMCGPAFEEELKFWGIDEQQMEPCCWGSFTRHREAEENLKSFEGPGFEDLHQNLAKQFGRGLLDEESYSLKVWEILDDPHSSKNAKIFSLVSCCMIILSVAGYCLGTMPLMRGKEALLNNINYVCVVFFTAECVGRFVTTPDRKAYLLDYNNWIDVISVVPSYLVITLKNNWVKNLVIIRLLRVFKFFKLSYGLQVLVHTLKASSYELTLLFLMLLIPLVIFSSIIYAVESNLNEDSKFVSIPATFWWCLITMTTVGYGDITPVTWPGQLIGSVCAIFGLLTVALPISVIGGNFTLYYEHVRARLRLPQKNRSLLQVNMHGVLRQTQNLSHRDRSKSKNLKDRQKYLEQLISESLEEDHHCLTDDSRRGSIKGVYLTPTNNILANGLRQKRASMQDTYNHYHKDKVVATMEPRAVKNGQPKPKPNYRRKSHVENPNVKIPLRKNVERCLSTPNSKDENTQLGTRCPPAISCPTVNQSGILLKQNGLCYMTLKTQMKTEIEKIEEDTVIEFDSNNGPSRPVLGHIEKSNNVTTDDKMKGVGKPVHNNKESFKEAIRRDSYVLFGGNDTFEGSVRYSLPGGVFTQTGIYPGMKKKKKKMKNLRNIFERRRDLTNGRRRGDVKGSESEEDSWGDQTAVLLKTNGFHNGGRKVSKESLV